MSSINIQDPIKPEELERLCEICMDNLKREELHSLRNDAKLRAVNTTQSYEEFKDIVDAAHLNPITKQDKNNPKTKSSLWNSSARDIEQ